MKFSSALGRPSCVDAILIDLPSNRRKLLQMRTVKSAGSR